VSFLVLEIVHLGVKIKIGFNLEDGLVAQYKNHVVSTYKESSKSFTMSLL
jgi:hypothetical protein